MSDTVAAGGSGTAGPALTENVEEVQGHFPDDATLQVALGELTLRGFDRADFSLPQDRPDQAMQTPSEGADNPVDQIDKSQLRTMGTGMAGYAGAVVAAGATLATGGAAAVAVAAAVAAGAGAAATANAVGRTADNASTDDRNERGQAGTLILAVRLRQPDKAGMVTDVMRTAGATDVKAISRGETLLTAGVSSASWTGG